MYFFFLLFFANILVSEANSWRCDYVYVKKAKGYFKYHKIPANWRDARLRCKDEGAVLASPHPEEIYDTLLDLMKDGNISAPIFIGIHATISKGDYRTIDGIPLSKIPIKWLVFEPDNFNDNESCLILTSGGFAADKNCLDPYPYYCYKEKKEDDTMFQGSCGTTDRLYEYSDVTNTCYKYHMVPRQWSRANMACFSEGGHLAIINSYAEAEVIRKLYAKNLEPFIIGTYRKDIAFLGFHDRDEQSDWRTINDETLNECGYESFNMVEPNNIHKHHHCGCVLRSGLLDSCKCEEQIPFICEKKPNSLICLNEDEY